VRRRRHGAPAGGGGLPEKRIYAFLAIAKAQVWTGR
jgi:hypothetical protein